MTIVFIIGAAAIGFIAGILAGHANKNKVNTVVADTKAVSSTVVADVKKI